MISLHVLFDLIPTEMKGGLTLSFDAKELVGVESVRLSLTYLSRDDQSRRHCYSSIYYRSRSHTVNFYSITSKSSDLQNMLKLF